MKESQTNILCLFYSWNNTNTECQSKSPDFTKNTFGPKVLLVICKACWEAIQGGSHKLPLWLPSFTFCPTFCKWFTILASMVNHRHPSKFGCYNTLHWHESRICGCLWAYIAVLTTSSTPVSKGLSTNKNVLDEHAPTPLYSPVCFCKHAHTLCSGTNVTSFQ